MICKHCKKPILAKHSYPDMMALYWFHLDTQLETCDDGQHYAEPETEQ